MIKSGTPPNAISTVLNLAHSVHGHDLSAAALYGEALSLSLTSYDQSSSDNMQQLELIMESVSQHETQGWV